MFRGISDEVWRQVYRLAKNVSMDHKIIIEMQFNILHRMSGTRKHLLSIGKVANPECRFCEMHVETVEHLFYECFVITKHPIKFN